MPTPTTQDSTETIATPPTAPPEKGLKNVEGSILLVFRMLAQIERLTDSEIKRVVFSAPKKEELISTNSSSTTKTPASEQNTPKLKIHTNCSPQEKLEAANLLHSLGEYDASSEDELDLARRIHTIKSLRDSVVKRFLSSTSQEFQSKSEIETSKLAASLQQFLAASQEKEIYYCTRDRIAWGKQDIKRASHSRVKEGLIPDEFLEVAYCLAQICIGNRKNLLQKGTPAESLQTAAAFTKIKNPNTTPNFPELFNTRAANLVQNNFASGVTQDLHEIYLKLNPDAKSLETLQSKIALFPSALNRAGTDLETYDNLQKEEIEVFKNIKKLHDGVLKNSEERSKEFLKAKAELVKTLKQEKIDAFHKSNGTPTVSIRDWEDASRKEKADLTNELNSLLRQRQYNESRLLTQIDTITASIDSFTSNPNSPEEFYTDLLSKTQTLKSLRDNLESSSINDRPPQELRKQLKSCITKLRENTQKIDQTTLTTSDFERVAKLLSPQLIKSHIFHKINVLKPEIESVPSLILTNQLCQNSDWVAKFLEVGDEALYSSKEAQTIFAPTDAQAPIYHSPNQHSALDALPLHEAFRLLDLAEDRLYQPYLSSAIEEEIFLSVPLPPHQVANPENLSSADERAEMFNLLKSIETNRPGLYATTKSQIEKAAHHLHNSTSSDPSNPIEKGLSAIKEKSEALSHALQQEIEGAKNSIESLPKSLKNKEDQDITEAALVRIIAHLSKKNFQTSLLAVEEALVTELSKLVPIGPQDLNEKLFTHPVLSYESTPESKEKSVLLSSQRLPTSHLNPTEQKQVINLIELLATTNALKTLAVIPKSDPVFSGFMSVLSHTSPPKTPAEHAFVSLCDNASTSGIKIRTYAVLEKITRESSQLDAPISEHFPNIIKSNLYTLKDWREMDSGITTATILETNFTGYKKTTNSKELALSLCRIPLKLKDFIKRDLKEALKTALKPKIWKHPKSLSPRAVDSKNEEYLFTKKEYAGSEPKLLKKIQNLHSKTIEVEAAASGNLEAKLAALSWHLDPKIQTKNLAGILNKVEALPKTGDLEADSNAENSLFESLNNFHEKKMARLMLDTPALKGVAKSLIENPRSSLLHLENSILDSILDCPQPEAAISYLETWNNSIGHTYYITGQLEKPMHLPLIAARIQNKVFNILELGKHVSRVAKDPEALTNTFIQQIQKQNKILRQKNLEEKVMTLQPDKNSDLLEKLKGELKIIKENNSSQQWVKRALNQKEALTKSIEEKRGTIENKKQAFENQNWDDIENSHENKKLAKMQIQRDVRLLTQTILKKERIIELLHISDSLKENPDIEDIAAALVETPHAQNFGDALNRALKTAHSLADSPSALPLASTALAIPMEADIYDMLEGSTLQEEIDDVRKTLKEAGSILSQYNPKAHAIDYTSENLKSITRKLQDAAFECLGASELKAWADGAKLWNPTNIQEELLKRNPSLIKSKEKWQKTLQEAESSSIELFSNSPLPKQTERKPALTL